MIQKKSYHPRQQSMGPWAKRASEFGGGADCILDAHKWLDAKRDGERRRRDEWEELAICVASQFKGKEDGREKTAR